MKRNLDIIRAILLQVEELPPGHLLKPDQINIESADKAIVAEHVRLLAEAAYIEANIQTGSSWFGVEQVVHYEIYRLLNDGHDFVANAKNETIWKQTNAHIQKIAGDVPLAVVKAVLAKLTMESLGI